MYYLDCIFLLLFLFDMEFQKLFDANLFLRKGKNVIIDKLSTIIGPCIIGSNTEVRPGAYIRGNAIIGKMISAVFIGSKYTAIVFNFPQKDKHKLLIKNQLIFL